MADDKIEIGVGINPSGAESGGRRAAAAVKGVATGSKELDAALKRLRSSIDPTFAAMERYNKAHRENLALLRSGMVSRREYNAGMKAAKALLQEETAAIERNSAAGRAAAAEAKAAKREAAQAAKAAAQEERRLQRETAAAARQAAREKAQAERQARAEERRLIREAAAAAKQAARETAAAERQAAREALAAKREAAAAQKAAARETAAVERQAAREAAEAAKQAAREQRQASREAAAAAKQAAREKAAAEKQAAAATREAAAETQRLARAEKQAATAAQELRASIDPAYAAQMRYNQTMLTASNLLMQNKLRTGEWIAIQRQAKAQMDLNVRSLGRMNAMNVQIGYQAQDVIASAASGISPLVILAQQGGQTAAALSTMGGTAGRVAAFFAGPWGAAILGATMVLGYLWQSMDEGESSTKDLMNAEERRTMSVKELTTALRDYVKAQRDANTETRQSKMDQVGATSQTYRETLTQYATAQQRVIEAQRVLNELVNAPITTRANFAQYAGAMAAARTELFLAEKQVKSLKSAADLAQEALIESQAAYVQNFTSMSELERRESDERTAAYRSFKREASEAGADQIRQNAALVTYQRQLTEITERYKKAKDEEAAARRENTRAIKEEEKAMFTSRQDAIGTAGQELQKQGYSVSENAQFGGVKGNHPGMGNSAHGQYAIDVNIGRGNVEANDPVMAQQMEETVLAYQRRGFRVLWNGKVYNPGANGASYDIPAKQNQHKDHAHIEAPASIVGKPAGSGLANDLIRIQEEQYKASHEAMIADLEFKQEMNREDLRQVLELQDQKIEAIKAFYGEESKEALDAMREKARIQQRQDREILQLTRDAINSKLDLEEIGLERQAALWSNSRDMATALIDQRVQYGIMSEREGLAAKAEILDADYSQEVEHENRLYALRVKALRDQLSLEDLPVRERARINAEIERMEAEHLATMEIMHSGYAKKVQEANIQAANVSNDKWMDITSTFTGSLTTAFQGFWTRSMSLQQMFIQGADAMVYKMFDMGAKMLQNWIMQQVGMTTVQQVQDSARTGSALASESIKKGAAISGAATQQTVGATAAMSEIGARAATSAAGAYSSTVVIPFIGPVAAPVAAAAALAAVLGFGALISAKGGMGEVPSDQLAMVHKKEMILPAWIAEPMRKSIATRGTGGMMGAAAAAGTSAREAVSNRGGDANFYFQPNHTNQSASMSDLLRGEGRELRKWFRNEVRNGALRGVTARA